jgi:hypothetical protein
MHRIHAPLCARLLRAASAQGRHLLVAATLVLLAACGPGGAGNTTNLVSQNIDPCSLVSQQTVSKVLGAAVQPKRATTTILGVKTGRCDYSPAQISASFAFASIGLIIDANTTTAQHTFADLSHADQIVAKSHYQNVSGIGNAAFFDSNTAALDVLKSNAILIIEASPAGSLGSQNAAKQLSAAKQLAALAASRL